MSELNDIASTLGTSEPIFKITAERDGQLNFKVKQQYVPTKTGDPVQALIVEAWRESLDVYTKRFEKHINIESAYSTIVDTVQKVFVNCSPLKNPKQSTLYKWLNGMPLRYNGPLSPGFIALYRYIVNCNIQGTGNKNNPHAKNVIAILELMKEKYEV